MSPAWHGPAMVEEPEAVAQMAAAAHVEALLSVEAAETGGEQMVTSACSTMVRWLLAREPRLIAMARRAASAPRLRTRTM